MNPLQNYSLGAFEFASGLQTFQASNQGNVFYVRPRTGSDGQDGRSPQTAFKTLATALGACTANQNDIVYMLAESNTAGNTTDYQAAALNWNKDGVHLIGVNGGSMIGSRSRIAQLSTVKTIEDLVTVSANGCYIANLEIFQGVATSTATSPRALVVSGVRNVFENCQISGNGDTGGSMDTAGARSLAVTGDENTFKNCYIGLDTVIRGTQTTEIDVGNSRNIFDNCVVESYTSLSTFKALTTTSTVAGRFVLLRNTMLCAIQNISSAVAPTGAIAHAQAGNVYMQGGGVYGYANVSTADATTVLVSAPAGGLVDMGLATGVDIA